MLVGAIEIFCYHILWLSFSFDYSELVFQVKQ